MCPSPRSKEAAIFQRSGAARCLRLAVWAVGAGNGAIDLRPAEDTSRSRKPSAACPGRRRRRQPQACTSSAHDGTNVAAPVPATRQRRTTPTVSARTIATPPPRPTPNAILGDIGAPSARRRATPSAINAKVRRASAVPPVPVRRPAHRPPPRAATRGCRGRRQRQLEQRERALGDASRAASGARTSARPPVAGRQNQDRSEAGSSAHSRNSRFRSAMSRRMAAVSRLPRSAESVPELGRGRSDMTDFSIYGPNGPYMVIDCLATAR
jgi:hypothetical protein